MTAVKKGQKELKTSWPFTSGLTAGTTKQKGRDPYLEPQLASLVARKDKIGF